MILLLLAILMVLGLIALSALFLYGYYKNQKEDVPNFSKEVCVIVPCKEKGIFAGENAFFARWPSTIESFPPEKRRVGRSNCAVTSRKA